MTGGAETHDRPSRVRRVEQCMGTVFTLDVRTAGVEEDAIRRAVDWLHWVDATFSTYRPDSAINRLGRGDLSVRDCPSEVGEVLALCADAAQTSHGYFTTMVNGRLDPSGLVKGWAVERASDLLRSAGAACHAVNGGGDIQLAGEPTPGLPWRVGISHPARPATLATVLAGRDLAVATTGTAERGPHVVNPFTGRAATDMASITLVGDHLAAVDAYATAAFAMGAASRDWVDRLPGIEAFAVTRDGATWQTAGFPTAAEIAPVNNATAEAAVGT